MKQTPEQTRILDALVEYVKTTKKTYAYVASQLGVTQNTISNWKKGSSISIRNQQKILQLIGVDDFYENCDLASCSCRNTKNPVLRSLISMLGDFPERDIAKIYAYALELRDLPGQYRYSAPAPMMRAAEDPVSYNS